MPVKEEKDISIDKQLDLIIEKNKDGASAMKKIIDAISKEKDKINQDQKKDKAMKKIYFVLSMLATMLIGSLDAQSWVSLTTGTSYILYDISFAPGQNDVGYAGGMQYTYNAEGVVIKTTDGGDNWTEVLGGAGTDGIEAIAFISADTGFIAGWNDYFAKTTDGGTTWTTMTVGSNNWYFVDIEFWDSDNGIAAAVLNSGTNAIYVTSDGGTTWTTATGINQNIQDVCYANATTLFSVGGDEKIAKSTDGGNTWTNIYTGILTYYFFGVDFDGDFGIVGGEDGKIMSTTDGGSSWSTFTTGYENFYAAHVYNSDSAYMGGTDENIYKTTDSGASWGWEYNGSGASHLYKIKTTANNTSFACGSQGLILRKEAPLTAAFTADNEDVCAGGTVNFTDMSTGATSWDWTFEGGTPATSTDQNPSVVYSNPGTFDVSLEVSDGIDTQTLTMTDYINVVVLPLQPDTPSGETSVCAGSTVQYSTNTVAYAETYTWEVNPSDAGIISGDSTIADFVASETWTGDYTVKVRAANTCGDGDWSNELSCALNAAPAEFNLSSGGDACEGGDGVEITLDGSETGVDYYLHHAGDTVSGPIAGTGSELSFGFFTDGGYYSSTAFNGTCSAFMVGDAIITLNLLPAMAGTPTGPDTVCAALSSEYTVAEVEGATSYVWTIIPAEAGTIEGDSLVGAVSWDATYEGIAEIAARGENDCGAGPSGPSLEVMVYAEPAPVISGDELVCKNDNGVYSVEYSQYSQYSWTIDGGNIVEGGDTNEITVYWTADQGSTTHVDLTETKTEGCVTIAETFDVTVDQCVGVDENTFEYVKFYPNPATNKINVELSNIFYKFVEFGLIDIQGKVVYSNRVEISDGVYSGNIGLGSIPEGLYLFTAKSDDNLFFAKKVMVIK